jgi:hypothetical protein
MAGMGRGLARPMSSYPGLGYVGGYGQVREPRVPEPMQRFQDSLSTHVESTYRAGRLWANTNIVPTLEYCLRTRVGEYDPTKLAQIRSNGGTELYFRLTSGKCADLYAWLKDVFLPIEDRSWDLTNTPIEDLPPNVYQAVVSTVAEQFRYEYRQRVAMAQQLPIEQGRALMAELKQVVAQSASMLEEQVRKRLKEEARKAAEEMARRLDDQLREGGYYQAMDGVLQSLSMYPLAILKGPVLSGRRRMKWNPYGMAEATEEPILTWECVNPWYLVTSPNARRSLCDDYICEEIWWPVHKLQEMSNAPGWMRPRLQQAVNEFLLSRTPPPPPDIPNAAQNLLELRPQTPEGWTTLMPGLEWWGVVSGSMLHDWSNWNEQALEEFGFRGIEREKWYAITAIKIGHWVVKCMPVLDPLMRFPYYGTSFDKIPGRVWGEGLPEKMRDCQDAYNAACRAMVNNLAFAAGPCLAYDAHATKPLVVRNVQPYGVIPYDGTRSNSTRDPVKWVTTQVIARDCIEAANFYSDAGDNRTGIPRYQMGDSDVGGAGQTASGLSMLLSTSAKKIKCTVGNVDQDVTQPNLEATVDFNNAYSTDAKLKGDVRVVGRGALYVLTRDMRHMRRQDALKLAQAFPEFFRPTGVALMLRNEIDNSDMPGEKVIVSDEELEAAAALPQQGPGGQEAQAQGGQAPQPGQGGGNGK